ncbi:MAG: discoidin domain-containing protein [Myxococcota bacterium]
MFDDIADTTDSALTGCSDAVPTLTGNSSRVSTSGVYSSRYPAWKVFDGGSSMWISQTFETPAWVSYDFGRLKTVKRYTVTNSNGSLTSRAPKDFHLEGWTGSGWRVVDSRYNQTGWTSGVPRSYNVSSPGAYSKYRLRITDDNDSRAGVVVISLSDLRFETCGCSDLVPTLTTNSSRVSTSGIFSASYPAWKAFDGGSSMWISKTFETPAWIGYDFGSTRRVEQYTLTNTNGSLTSRAPKNFQLQGSNGGAWYTVDSRVNQTGWRSGTPRSYSVSNPGYYQRYRLYVTDDNDSRAGVVVISLGDLRFEGCGG